jgi:RNA polymerase sigma factor (sigma-70 family)
MTPSELLLANLSLLRELVGFLARRYRLHPEQVDELESFVRLRLVEDDYGVLRQWRQQSTLRTYLTVVVQRIFHDYCNQLWGKWRASAAAQRLGPVAETLEALIYREGLTFGEAAQSIAAEGRVSYAQLSGLYQQIPPRPGRPRQQPIGAEEVAAPTTAANPEEALLRRSEEDAIGRAVASSLRLLRAQDRVLLRLRFGEGLSIAQVSRAIETPQKALYKRLTSILKSIRRDLRKAGFEDHDVAELLAHRPTLDFGLTSEGEIVPSRPSKHGDAEKEPEQS